MKTQDPVHPFGQPFIMRGTNSRSAFLPHEAEEFSKNDIGSMFVQIAGRLVSKNKGPAVGERASDGDALLFASRKLAWALAEAMAETYRREQDFRTRARYAGVGIPDHVRQYSILNHATIRQNMTHLKY